jgi:hypothetical protein
VAHLDIISTDLVRVAREIGQFLDKGLANPLEESATNTDSLVLEIGETLTVWSLRKEAFEALDKMRLEGDLINWLEQDPILHHQIRLSGKTVGFAQSYLVDGIEDKALFRISASPFASQISGLFEVIERNPQGDPVIAADPVVRLLEIPPFGVFALWVYAEARRESRIVIIDAADRYKELTPGALLNSEDFFEALRRGGPLLDVI